MNTEEMLVTILQKINSMEDRMGSMGDQMGSMEKRMGSMEDRMGSMEDRMGSMEKRMSSMEKKMDERMDAMEARIQPLETLPQQVKEIQMTLENEIQKNIRIIAEGHLDLIRKLDEALEFQKEKEIFLLRVTALEGDVQRIKNRIGMTV